MRKYQPDTRPCESCGRTTGALWVPYPKVLDFGVPTMAPMEPDMMQPKRCDECETLAQLADPDYRALCGPDADRMEREAITEGGVPPAK